MILLVALISLRTIKNGEMELSQLTEKQVKSPLRKKMIVELAFYIGHVIPYLMEHAKQGDYKKSVILAWY